MTRLALTMIYLLIANAVTGQAVSLRAPSTFPAYKLAGPDDPLDRNARFIPPVGTLPGRDDTFQAGDTWYDYQTNGCVGKMIEVDEQGGVHVTWMDGYSSENAGTRQQKYNYYFDGEWLEEDGVQAPPGTRSGYGNLTLTNEDEQRAVVFCHAIGILAGADPTTVVLVDFATGWGAFENYLTPNYPENRILWPMGVISPGGMIHVVYNRSDAGMISYTGTDFRDGEPSFPDVPIVVTPTSLNTYRIARSPNSDRAAITWISSRTGIPAPPEWDGFLAYQMNNDLWVAWTDDGENWNFDNPLNVTQCIPPNPDEADSVLAMGDTLRPFTTHDVIFDENDMIHIVFEARGLWEMPVYDPDVDRPPIYGLTVDAAILFHWTEEDCTFSPVADGWFTQQVRDENDSLVLWPQPGAWKSNVCSPSLAYSDDGDLYCVYNFYPTGDYNDYVDNTGRCHGDVAVTVSTDNGRSWSEPTMLTETSSPLAEPGEGMCEEYPTVAERIDNNLHVLYILDHEAGSVIQDDNASNTLNEVNYLSVPLGDVARDEIWDGPGFHIEVPVSVKDKESAELVEFRLTGAYPNPFNSTTRIEYDVASRQNIELSVFSLTGQRVAQLYKGEALSGHHQVSLTGDDLPAGVYIVRLAGESATISMKIALVR